MKKLMSLLLALIMVLTMVACGGDTAEDAGAGPLWWAAYWPFF